MDTIILVSSCLYRVTGHLPLIATRSPKIALDITTRHHYYTISFNFDVPPQALSWVWRYLIGHDTSILIKLLARMSWSAHIALVKALVALGIGYYSHRQLWRRILPLLFTSPNGDTIMDDPAIADFGGLNQTITDHTTGIHSTSDLDDRYLSAFLPEVRPNIIPPSMRRNLKHIITTLPVHAAGAWLAVPGPTKTYFLSITRTTTVTYKGTEASLSRLYAYERTFIVNTFGLERLRDSPCVFVSTKQGGRSSNIVLFERVWYICRSPRSAFPSTRLYPVGQALPYVCFYTTWSPASNSYDITSSQLSDYHDECTAIDHAISTVIKAMCNGLIGMPAHRGWPGF